ncbi:MAG: COG1361 S-layer family protein [Candidatus Micrarchaeia archaeon]
MQTKYFDGRKMMFVIMGLMILSMPYIINAQVVQSPNDALSIINLNTTPTTIVAGDNVILTFQLFNSYSAALQSVNLYLEASNPIIKVSPSSSYLIDTIGSGQYGGMGYDFFTYVLHIPSTLPSGEYTIDVVASYEAPTSTSAQYSQTVPAQSIIPINFYVYGKPNIKLTISPEQPLQPGVLSNIYLDLTNTGTAPIYNITLNINNSKYFQIMTQNRFAVGALQAGQSIQLPTSLLPNQTILNGTYDLNGTITYTSEEGNITNTSISSEVPIIINKPNIIVSIESGIPQNLYPGSNQTVILAVQNIGTGEAKNVYITFNSTNTISIGSVSRFFISSLPPSSSVSEKLFLMANKNDSLNMYNIPMYIKYQYSNYQNNTNIKSSLPIQISPSAVIQIEKVYSNLSVGATYAPITFEIKNIGNEEAQALSINLQSTYPITPINSNQYINSLPPGQSTNVTFYVSIDTSGNIGNYPVTLYSQWSQPNGNSNQEYYSTSNYYATVEGSSSSSSGSSSNGIELVAIIIIIILAYYMYKKAQKGKKAQKSKNKVKEEQKE